MQGGVDEAGHDGVRASCAAADRRAELVAALGHALLARTPSSTGSRSFEAAVRQSTHVAGGSEEGALILAGLARFLAAHTPTRRELPPVVRIATRLRRGEALYEEAS